MTSSTTPAAARMQRLLALVPWVVARDGPTVDEICTHFDITRVQLAADLEVVWLVGVPPYTPDALIDVAQEGDRVWIRYADMFASPQRLTPDQALALLAAGGSILALPGADGDGPLARGVAKLAEVLGVDLDNVLDVHLGGGDPAVVDALSSAVARRQRITLDYYSHGRDVRAERDVDPYLVHAEQGSLYLLGHCHRAGALRRFRVDRIASVTPTGATFERPDDPVIPSLFEPDAADPRVTLDLEPSARWVADAYPMESVEERGEQLRVTLAVSEPVWLERLLVNLGATATVVDAPPELTNLARRAADAILARYR